MDDTGKAPQPSDDRIAAAISDEYVRRVLSVCVRKARAAKDIEQSTGLPAATVYRHLKSLVEDGLMVVERSAMTAEGKRYELYRSRIETARIEFDGEGVRVHWTPVEATEERLARAWTSLRGF